MYCLLSNKITILHQIQVHVRTYNIRNYCAAWCMMTRNCFLLSIFIENFERVEDRDTLTSTTNLEWKNSFLFYMKRKIVNCDDCVYKQKISFHFSFFTIVMLSRPLSLPLQDCFVHLLKKQTKTKMIKKDKTRAKKKLQIVINAISQMPWL